MATVVPPSTELPASFVDWGAVAAGAFLAAALSFVLLAFGSSIGLTAASPWPNSGLPAWIVASLAVFWVMAQQIAAFLAGGYVAGRMRGRWGEARETEIQFRDGLHGGLVWAVGVVIGAALLFATAGGVAKSGITAAGTALSSTAAEANPSDFIVDRLLRPQGAPPQPSNPGDMRREVSRILTGALGQGGLAGDDRAYLARLVSQQTGRSSASCGTSSSSSEPCRRGNATH